MNKDKPDFLIYNQKDDSVIAGYKGKAVFDSPLVYAPFLPIMGASSSIPDPYKSYNITSESPLIVTECDNCWDNLEQVYSNTKVRDYIIDENLLIEDLETILKYLKEDESLSHDYLINHLPDSLKFLIL